MSKFANLNFIVRISFITIMTYFISSNYQAQGAGHFLYLKNYNNKINLTELINKHNNNEKKSLNSQHISIVNAYIHASIGNSYTTAAYMKIYSLRTDRVLKLISPKAKRIELHLSSIDKKGVMKMKRIDNIKISPSNPLVLKPGSYHFMVMGLKEKLKPGDKFPLTIFFDSGIKLNLKLNALNSISKKHKMH